MNTDQLILVLSSAAGGAIGGIFFGSILNFWQWQLHQRYAVGSNPRSFFLTSALFGVAVLQVSTLLYHTGLLNHIHDFGAYLKIAADALGTDVTSAVAAVLLWLAFRLLFLRSAAVILRPSFVLAMPIAGLICAEFSGMVSQHIDTTMTIFGY